MRRITLRLDASCAVQPRAWLMLVTLAHPGGVRFDLRVHALYANVWQSPRSMRRQHVAIKQSALAAIHKTRGNAAASAFNSLAKGYPWISSRGGPSDTLPMELSQTTSMDVGPELNGKKSKHF
jgi:hypothetical protein